jgi:acetyltransferase
MGLPAFASISCISGKIDLAVIATPAKTVPGVIRECAEAGVRGAVIVSAGFRETGEAGIALEKEVLREANGRIRIIGPNCLGLICPAVHLNATFAAGMARRGHIAFLSQSGALCTAILGWSLKEGLGFSTFVSTGAMMDVGWGDLIRHFGYDPETRSIVIYMESVGDARSFVSAAREVALSKPIIVIKPGRTSAGARAAASHTGALTGSDDVLEAAFSRCGVLRVDTIAELFYLAEALDKQPLPKGPHLAIVTNAGGPAVLATDALLRAGGRMAALEPGTIDELNSFLPPHWSHQNPIDILGDAGVDRYSRAVVTAEKDSGTDGLLAIFTTQAITDPAAAARELAHGSKVRGKPLLASWMGGTEMEAADKILSEANIPAYPWPDAAARVFELMWQYSANIQALYETPEPSELEATSTASARAKATEMVREVRAAGRTLFTEAESKALLAAYGIPVMTTVIATDTDKAVDAARQIGYPVAVKLHSTTITHKSDVGGVRLNIEDDDGVRRAWREIEESVTKRAGTGCFQGVTVQPMARSRGYELILGSTYDEQFGPVLLFGSGGELVEVYRDRAMELPPLNSTLARRMIGRTVIYKALCGVRGRPPIDLAELERLLVRFSWLIL